MEIPKKTKTLQIQIRKKIKLARTKKNNRRGKKKKKKTEWRREGARKIPKKTKTL